MAIRDFPPKPQSVVLEHFSPIPSRFLCSAIKPIDFGGTDLTPKTGREVVIEIAFSGTFPAKTTEDYSDFTEEKDFFRVAERSNFGKVAKNWDFKRGEGLSQDTVIIPQTSTRGEITP